MEVVTRGNKETRISVVRYNTSVMHTGNGLQHRNRGRTDSNDASSGPMCLIDQFSGRCVQFDFFAMHFVLTDILTLNWAECIKSHMQCHKTDADALLSQSI